MRFSKPWMGTEHKGNSVFLAILVRAEVSFELSCASGGKRKNTVWFKYHIYLLLLPDFSRFPE